jgi:hypothetical protein
MTEESELIQKQEELKYQLSTGEYKTLIDVILDKTGRFIQRITRNPKPPSFLFTAVVLTLFYVLIGLLVSIFVGDKFEAIIAFYGVEYAFLLAALVVGLMFVAVIGYKIYIGNVFKTLNDYLLDKIEVIANLADLQRWLVAICNVKRSLLFCLVFGIVFGLYGPFLMLPILGGFIGFGPALLNFILAFQTGIIIYFLFLFLALPVKMSRYQFKLYAADPSSSEVIDKLSDMLSSFVYLTAVLATIGTFILAFIGLLTVSLITLVVLLAWGPLITLFIINQYALRKIITRAKWKKLNEIQAKIETLEIQEHIPSEKTLGHLGKLMDYHDRIKATRNSALDIRAGLSFLNSLLFPVLAFILANLDQVLGLFN